MSINLLNREPISGNYVLFLTFLDYIKQWEEDEGNNDTGCPKNGVMKIK